MSCPSCIKVYDKDFNLLHTLNHNWGFLPPTNLQVGSKILKLVEGLQWDGFNERVRLHSKWHIIEDRFFGKMTRDSYYEMYDTLKAIHYNVYNEKDFNIENFFKR
jgi:hypothetical protein